MPILILKSNITFQLIIITEDITISRIHSGPEKVDAGARSH